MKFLSFFSLLLVLGFSSPAFAQAPSSSPSEKPQEEQPQQQTTEEASQPVSPEVQAQVDALLAGVTLDNVDAKTLTTALVAILESNKAMAPAIVALAVESLGKSLGSDPAKAASVISTVVSESARALPGSAPAIVSAAVKAIPAEIKATVAPQVVDKTVQAVQAKADKAAVLNAAYDSIKGDSQQQTLIQSFDTVAKDNKIEIIPNSEQTNSETRYVIEDGNAATEEGTGFGQGTINAGESLLNTGATQGGSGSNTGNSTQPRPAS